MLVIVALNLYLIIASGITGHFLGAAGRIIHGSIFCVLGTLFLIFGILTHLQLKYAFKCFYIENKCLLYLATIGLSVPLIIRGSSNLLNFYWKSYTDWVLDHRNEYFIIMNIFTELIPMSF